MCVPTLPWRRKIVKFPHVEQPVLVSFPQNDAACLHEHPQRTFQVLALTALLKFSSFVSMGQSWQDHMVNLLQNGK